MSAPTCLLCASGCLAVLLREASGIAILLTARLWMASSLPSDVSEAAVHTDETYSIFDLTMFLWIIAHWFGFKYGEILYRRLSHFPESLAIMSTKCV